MPEAFLGLSWVSSLLICLILSLRIHNAEVEAYVSSIPEGDFCFSYMIKQLKEFEQKTVYTVYLA